MISAPVTEKNAVFLNLVNTKDLAVNKNSDGQDFAKTMQKVSKQSTDAGTSTVVKQPQKKPVQQEDTTVENDIKSETQTGEEKAATQEITSCDKAEETAEPEEMDAITAELKDAIKDAAKDMLAKIAKELDIPQEDILEIMNCLGMTLTDVLDTGKLTALVVEASGMDMMSLVTNEELYADVQTLTEQLQDTLTDILDEFGISEDVFQQACKMIEADLQTVEVQTVEPQITELIPQKDSTEQDTEPVVTIQNETQLKEVKPEKGEDVQQEQTQEAVEDIPDKKVPAETEMEQRSGEHSAHDEEKSLSKHDIQGKETFSAVQGQNAVQHTDFTESLTDAALDAHDSARADTENIMRQIMDYMHVKVKEDLTEMEMQLHPASLGTVNLQLTARGGSITAQFTVQNETVKSAMEAQVVQLKEQLESQGVKIEAVEVTLASHGFERNLNEQNQGKGEQQASDKVKANRRKIINLNDYDSLESMDADTDDATRIAMEMMSSNGNSLDMLA